MIFNWGLAVMNVREMFKDVSFWAVVLCWAGFCAFGVFASEPIRSAGLDRYILYYIDELIRFYHIKTSFVNPLVFLNPFAKPLSMLISHAWARIFGLDVLNLRILSACFGAGILFFARAICLQLGLGRLKALMVVLLTACMPSFFLSSIAMLSEPFFGFFLIAAVYCCISQRYFLSALCISVLPLARQEGLLYMIGWYYLLFFSGSMGRRKWYALLMPLPLLVWILLDHIVLGHPWLFVYSFHLKVSNGIPPDSLLPIQMLKPSYILGYVPLLVLTVWGMYKKPVSRGFEVLSGCLAVAFVLMVALNVLLVLVHESFVYELRFLNAVIPLVAVYCVIGLVDVLKRVRKKEVERGLVGVLAFSILLGLNVFMFFELQNLPYVRANVLSADDEYQIEFASGWVDRYMKRNNLKHVYATSMTDKIVRRILMYLPNKYEFGVIGGHPNVGVLNPVTFRQESISSEPGVLISIEPLELAVEKRMHATPLKTFFCDPKIYVFACTDPQDRWEDEYK